MPIKHDIGVVMVCGLGFGAAGGLLGLLLGLGSPGYYRGVFRAADDPRFNPMQVGLGLGLTQGLVCGLAVGCVVVLARAFVARYSLPGEIVDPSVQATVLSRTTATRLALALVLVVATAFSGAIGFLIGAIVGQVTLYQQRADVELVGIRPVLQDRRFTGVAAEPTSLGRVYLIGKVHSEQARNALKVSMRSLFGVEDARDMMADVEVVDE